MKITLDDGSYAGMYAEDYHVLTYAETGFSALSAYGERAGISSETLRKFEEQINDSDEPGSLHPQAEISVIPRRLVREPCGCGEFSGSLTTFLTSNREHIGATRLVMSFRDDVNHFIVEECKRVLKGPHAKGVDEVIIVIENMRE